MAVLGSLNIPYEQGELSLVASFPFGDLVTPFDTPTPDLLGTVIANRFPTPPAALGFLMDTALIPDIYEIGGLEGPYYAGGALAPSGDYLEPNIGQIWPR